MELIYEQIICYSQGPPAPPTEEPGKLSVVIIVGKVSYYTICFNLSAIECLTALKSKDICLKKLLLPNYNPACSVGYNGA